MKKHIMKLITLMMFICLSSLAYAGDIPEALLSSYDTVVYFGEVKSIKGDDITVIQVKNIKGEFEKGKEITYNKFAFTQNPKVGKIYLVGYIDKNNPLYVWEVTKYDTKALQIKQKDDMSKRMQEYLNKGDFEEKEQQRLKEMGKNPKKSEQDELPVQKLEYDNYVKNAIIFAALSMIIIGAYLILKNKKK